MRLSIKIKRTSGFTIDMQSISLFLFCYWGHEYCLRVCRRSFYYVSPRIQSHTHTHTLSKHFVEFDVKFFCRYSVVHTNTIPLRSQPHTHTDRHTSQRIPTFDSTISKQTSQPASKRSNEKKKNEIEKRFVGSSTISSAGNCQW